MSSDTVPADLLGKMVGDKNSLAGISSQEGNFLKAFKYGHPLLLDEINFVIYMQYVALKQWKHVLSYAKRKGIKIICDMPFYVGFDGVECWLHRDQFSIGPDNKLFEVGGVGPDAFSDVGQLWGTPIYNFKKMKEDNYKLLVDRVGYLMNLCDVLRIDHFRAFDTYYVIPGDATDARVGEWKIGPQDDFFNELYKKYPNTDLIAEDLGDLRPEVLEPLGINTPALAFGLGIERLAMIRYDLSDIRMLYKSDISWLREVPLEEGVKFD